MNIPLSPYAPENLVSRDGFSRPVPHLTLIGETQQAIIGLEGHYFVHTWSYVDLTAGTNILYLTLPVQQYVGQSLEGHVENVCVVYISPAPSGCCCLGKNMNAPRPFDRPPVRGKM